MNFDDLDFSQLPSSGEEAFVVFERQLNKSFEYFSKVDTELNLDNDYNYVGSHEPERTYVTGIMAFLDEYSLDVEISNISDLPDHDFIENFQHFKSRAFSF